MSVQLAEKIGRMIVVGFRGTEVSASDPIVECIRRFHLGGIWLCDHRAPDDTRLGNIASAAQVRHLVDTLQAAADRPLLVALDAEGGQVRRLAPEYGFPPTASAGELGRSSDVTATRHQAEQIACLLRELGFNLNLAPVVDLNINPKNPALGRRQRCFSADPHVVLEHARAFCAAHHAAGIACVAKHFPGHGSARGDTHVGLTDVSDTWSVAELLPFMGLIRERFADGVMTSHVINTKLDSRHPASLSHEMTTRLLREELGFEGVVITDDLGMAAVRDNYSFEQAVVLAIQAGADIVLHANTEFYDAEIGQRTFETIRRCVDRGEISAERIDQSYVRIMRLSERIARET